MGADAAAAEASIVYITAMIVSPVLGAAVDVIGHRVHLLVLAAVLLIPVFPITAFGYPPTALLLGIISYPSRYSAHPTLSLWCHALYHACYSVLVQP